MTCTREGCDEPIPASRGKRARYCSRYCQERRAFPVRPRLRDRPHVPKGCEVAEVDAGPDGGTLTSGPVEARGEPGDLHQSWDWLLELHGLDPAVFEVLGGSVNARMWDAHYGVDAPPRKFAYYKAQFVRRVPTEGRLDYAEARLSLLRAAQRPRKRADGPPATFLVLVADPQFGKGDGDGTEGTLARIRHGLDEIGERIEALRRAGWNITDALCGWLGDNTENVQGHYAMQGFSVDLPLTEQIEAATDTGVAFDARLIECVGDVLHVAVPGNHGEVRTNGSKANTALRDNYDTHALRQAAKVSRAAGHGSRWAFPVGDELSVTLRHRDRVHTFLHGHAGRSGARTAHDKIVRWAKDQAFGLRAPGESEFVWSGHYHHYSAIEQGRRVFVQAPALDGGSVWYAESAGIETPPGIFTAVLTGARGVEGLADQRVLATLPKPPTWEIDAEAA